MNKLGQFFGKHTDIVLVLAVYLAKAGASRERAQIADIEQRIGEEQRRVKLLRADAARLEQPARIEALSESVGLKAVDAAREASPDALPQIAARKGEPPKAKNPVPAGPASPDVTEGAGR